MTDPSTPQPTHEPETGQLAVTATGVGRRFGRHWAVAHVDLRLCRGESLLLVGANGSGKTTLLRMLCGLLRPSSGRVRVFGGDPRDQRHVVRPRLGLISHRTFLYESLTAAEHVRLWQRLGRRRLLTEAASAGELLAGVGLEGREDQPVSTFSAGMRKRLTLVRVRIQEPDLILLDEPFAALDPAGQALVADWLGEQSRAGRTLVLASHSLEQARTLCRRAVVMRRGQVAWRGPAHAVHSGLLDPAVPEAHP